MKNIEDKTNIGDNINNEVIKYSDSTVTKSDFGNFIKELTPKEKNFLDKIKKQDNLIDYKSLYFRGSNNKLYDFRYYDKLLFFLKNLYHGKDIREAEYRDQKGLKESIEELKNYNPTNGKYKKEKKDLLDNVEKL